VGIEQAREWFASDVLQPLMVAVNSAHTEVIAGAAQLGFPGVRLTPLTDLGKEKKMEYFEFDGNFGDPLFVLS
jgi:hypothetical protein